MRSLILQRIVWVQVGPRGEYKRRPAVICGIDGNEYLVACGSTTINEPIDPAIEVLLPYTNGKPHPWTKLTRKTVIVCDWIERVREEDVLDRGGLVPDSYFREILNRLPAEPN